MYSRRHSPAQSLSKADKKTTETFIVTGYVVPASIRPPSNLTGDNS